MKYAIIDISLGLGDLVFLEPTIRAIRNSGISQVHLFTRPDGHGIYRDYEGVQCYAVGDKAARMRLNDSGALYARIDSAAHAKAGYMTRVEAYLNMTLMQMGLPIPSHHDLTPLLTVGDELMAWAERYVNKKNGQLTILWQLHSSSTYKDVPQKNMLEAIWMVLDSGHKVIILNSRIAKMRRHRNLKWAKGLNSTRLMALCASVDRIVALDSFPLWLGAAVGTDIIGIFGPTSELYYAGTMPHMQTLSRNTLLGCRPCTTGCSTPECLDFPPEELAEAAIHGTVQRPNAFFPTVTPRIVPRKVIDNRPSRLCFVIHNDNSDLDTERVLSLSRSVAPDYEICYLVEEETDEAFEKYGPVLHFDSQLPAFLEDHPPDAIISSGPCIIFEICEKQQMLPVRIMLARGLADLANSAIMHVVFAVNRTIYDSAIRSSSFPSHIYSLDHSSESAMVADFHIALRSYLFSDFQPLVQMIILGSEDPGIELSSLLAGSFSALSVVNGEGNGDHRGLDSVAASDERVSLLPFTELENISYVGFISHGCVYRSDYLKECVKAFALNPGLDGLCNLAGSRGIIAGGTIFRAASLSEQDMKDMIAHPEIIWDIILSRKLNVQTIGMTGVKYDTANSQSDGGPALGAI